MKKFVAAAIAAMMAVSLAACSGGSASSSTTATKAAETQAAEKLEALDTGDYEIYVPETADKSLWPTGEVTVYVASSAGSNNDLVTRVITAALEEKTGKKFTVINQTDGGGVTAYESARNAKKDGLTLAANHSGVNVQYLLGQYAQNPDTELCTVASMAATGVNAYCTRADAPYNNLTELVQYAKDHPGEVKWGVKLGNATHLSTVQIAQALDLDLKYLEAGDQNDKLAGILGGQIDIGNMTPQAAEQYIQSGQLKILFTTAPYEDYENMQEWNGGVLQALAGGYNFLWATTGIDEGILNTIDRYMAEVACDPTVQEQLIKLGNSPASIGWKACEEYIHNDFESKWDAATAAGINKAAK